MNNELIERFDDGLEDLELYGLHDNPGYKKLKDLFPVIKAALSATLSPAHIEDGEEVDFAQAVTEKIKDAYYERESITEVAAVIVAQHQRMKAALVARNEWLEQVAVEAAETEKHALQVADAYRNGAALSAPPAAGVPEGWKLVPLEPTTEMKIAGDHAGFWCGDKYRAMIAAAPSPTKESGQ